MQVVHDTCDGQPVVLLMVPSGGPPVILDPVGWAALRATGVTSVIAQKGAAGEHIVARAGKRQTAAARLAWGEGPPRRIVFANGNRRDLRRANLATDMPKPPAPPRPVTDPAAVAWAALSDDERAASIRALVRAGYRRMWHAERDWLVRTAQHPLAHLLFPTPPPRSRVPLGSARRAAPNPSRTPP